MLFALVAAGRREGVELREGVGPFHRVGPGARAARRSDRHGGELERPRRVQVDSESGDPGRVAPQELAQPAVPARARQGHRASGGGVPGAQGGAQDGEDGPGLRVQDGPAHGRAAEPDRVAAIRTEGQFQRTDRVGAAAGGVRHRGCAEDARLAPAVRGDRHIRTGVDPLPRGDRKGRHTERVRPAGGQEREVQFRQGGDVRGLDAAASAVRTVQQEVREAVDRFVTGHDRAPVVRDEARPPRPARRIAQSYQPRPVPASHDPTLGRR